MSPLALLAGQALLTNDAEWPFLTLLSVHYRSVKQTDPLDHSFLTILLTKTV